MRGENHKGFPFISLDMPQMFSKTQMFTYRTLFWWGHDLIFSLILKQNKPVPLIANKLILAKRPSRMGRYSIGNRAYSLGVGERNQIILSPFQKLTEKDIRETIETVQYIKLCRFHSLSDPKFPELNWANTGLATWKILSKVCVD